MKGKLGKVIFRRINGRMVPIRIKNVADKIAEASDKYNKYRQIQAVGDKATYMGQLTLKIPKKGKTADLIDVRVPKEYRRKGISKNLFARATQFLEKAGFKFLRSDDLQHPAQAKIRSAYGRYKAGTKSKNRTKYVADQFGRWGEQSKLVKKDSVIDYLKNNSTGRQIKATTMLKKRKK